MEMNEGRKAELRAAGMLKDVEKATQPIPRDDIRAILELLWDDEKSAYVEHLDIENDEDVIGRARLDIDDSNPSVFPHLVRIWDWLDALP